MVGESILICCGNDCGEQECVGGGGGDAARGISGGSDYDVDRCLRLVSVVTGRGVLLK